MSQLPPSAKEPAGQRGACKARDSDYWRGRYSIVDENTRTVDSGSSSSKIIENHKDNFCSGSGTLLRLMGVRNSSCSTLQAKSHGFFAFRKLLHPPLLINP